MRIWQREAPSFLRVGHLPKQQLQPTFQQKHESSSQLQASKPVFLSKTPLSFGSLNWCCHNFIKNSGFLWRLRMMLSKYMTLNLNYCIPPKGSKSFSPMPSSMSTHIMAPHQATLRVSRMRAQWPKLNSICLSGLSPLRDLLTDKLCRHLSFSL